MHNQISNFYTHTIGPFYDSTFTYSEALRSESQIIVLGNGLHKYLLFLIIICGLIICHAFYQCMHLLNIQNKILNQLFLDSKLLDLFLCTITINCQCNYYLKNNMIRKSECDWGISYLLGKKK